MEPQVLSQLLTNMNRGHTAVIYVTRIVLHSMRRFAVLEIIVYIFPLAQTEMQRGERTRCSLLHGNSEARSGGRAAAWYGIRLRLSLFPPTCSGSWICEGFSALEARATQI